MRWTLLVAVATAVGCSRHPDPAEGARDEAQTPPREARPLEALRDVAHCGVLYVEVVWVGGHGSDRMAVLLKVKTLTPGGPLFGGWPDGGGRTLTDDRGNRLAPVPLTLSDRVDLADLALDVSRELGPTYKQMPKSLGTGPVHPDRPRFELLTFSRPAPGAAYVDLELDAAPVGGGESIRFRISRGQWEKN